MALDACCGVVWIGRMLMIDTVAAGIVTHITYTPISLIRQLMQN